MQEELDKVSLEEVIEIYNSVSAMLKSLQDKEKEAQESEEENA